MAGQKGNNAQQQAQNMQLRLSLAAAYSAVTSQQNVQSFQAFTFEDAANLQIAAINGPSTSTRPNALNEVQSILNNLVQAVTQIKALPAEQFSNPNGDTDVNTPA